MEARRRELLSEEGGYWRKRMAQELAARSLAGADAVAAAAATTGAAKTGAQVRARRDAAPGGCWLPASHHV